MSDLLSSLQRALVGRYTVEREIGRGGMATVFLAQDERLARRVALKVLSPDVSVALGAERFQREIEIASKLTHPNIVPLYDSGVADGALFYAMPFIDGESLRARLDRERQLPLDEAIRIATEIAGALDYAHRHGVLHRDVKPANILLEDGHAVIADFGIARALTRAAEGDKLTGTGVTLGTPTYMSPEQASGEQALDGRSDVYALGCVVYEMIAGQPPFTGPNAQAVLARHAMDTVPSLRVVRATIPEQIEDAILCALSKAPADRFATAQQFADALNGNTSATMKWQTMSRIASRGRLRRSALAVVAGAIAVLGAGGTIAVLGAGGSDGSWWTTRQAGEAAFDVSRVAVLPLGDRSGDGSLRHIADGLTESLIDKLGAAGVNVVSYGGVERYRGEVDPVRAAAELEAGSLVRGNIWPVGDSVRVTVELVDGRGGGSSDPTTFLLPSASMLAARDSLAVHAAMLIRSGLGEEVRRRRERLGTGSDQAWLLVQRARVARRQAETLARAGEADSAEAMFDRADSVLARAEREDPEWRVPIIERGWLAQRRASRSHSPRDMRRLMETGIAHAERALLLDSMDVQARELRGTVRFHLAAQGLEPRHDAAAALLDGAERDLVAATSGATPRASALATLALFQYRRFDKLEAFRSADRAYQVDKYLESAAEVLWLLFATSYDNKTFPQAETWCREGQRRFPKDPTFLRCELWLLTDPSIRITHTKVDSAWQLAARFDSLLSPAARPYYEREAQILVASVIGRSDGEGMLDSASRVLERARADHSIDHHGNLLGFEAAVRTMLGDTDEAIDLLERYLVVNPLHREGFSRNNAWWWRPLENDPRYQALMRIDR